MRVAARIGHPGKNRTPRICTVKGEFQAAAGEYSLASLAVPVFVGNPAGGVRCEVDDGGGGGRSAWGIRTAPPSGLPSAARRGAVGQLHAACVPAVRRH